MRFPQQVLFESTAILPFNSLYHLFSIQRQVEALFYPLKKGTFVDFVPIPFLIPILVNPLICFAFQDS